MMEGGRIGFGPSSVLERGELSALQGKGNSPAIKQGFITILPLKELREMAGEGVRQRKGRRDQESQVEKGHMGKKRIERGRQRNWQRDKDRGKNE